MKRHWLPAGAERAWVLRLISFGGKPAALGASLTPCVCLRLGWAGAHYACAGGSLAFALAWHLCAADRPAPPVPRPAPRAPRGPGGAGPGASATAGSCCRSLRRRRRRRRDRVGRLPGAPRLFRAGAGRGHAHQRGGHWQPLRRCWRWWHRGGRRGRPWRRRQRRRRHRGDQVARRGGVAPPRAPAGATLCHPVPWRLAAPPPPPPPPPPPGPPGPRGPALVSADIARPAAR